MDWATLTYITYLNLRFAVSQTVHLMAVQQRIYPWSYVSGQQCLVNICFLVCCSVLLKTAFDRRRRSLQVFPHHQMHPQHQSHRWKQHYTWSNLFWMICGFWEYFWPLHLAAWQRSQQDHAEKTEWKLTSGWHVKSWSDRGPIHVEITTCWRFSSR